jgi:multiple sugar transport system ATP-binding protein
MSGIRLERVSKTFGSTPVLENVDLEIRNAEFVTLLGPSGSGKTTLLRIIAGLTVPDHGEVLFDGRRVTRLPPNKRNVAMVFQDYALYPNMRVRENIGFCLKLRRLPRGEIRQQVVSVTQILGIEPLLDRWPQELSGGQRQRVALGRAIVRNPAVFLLDEPLSNLDAQLRVSMRAELQRIHRRLHTTMVHVTHDQEEAMSVSERIALINRGRVEQFDTPRDLYRRPQNVFVARFVGTPSINLLSCELVDEAGDRRIAGRDFSIALCDRGFMREVKLDDRRNLLVGLRPEDLTLVASPDRGVFRGEITVVERLGKEAVVYLTMPAGDEIVVRTVPTVPIEVGQVVGVMVAEADLYFFDRASGKAVRRAPPGG